VEEGFMPSTNCFNARFFKKRRKIRATA
jgi:hypothetical protein